VRCERVVFIYQLIILCDISLTAIRDSLKPKLNGFLGMVKLTFLIKDW